MAETYVTKAGDTLSGIAKQFYDDESQWPKIYGANKETIGDNSDLIQIGSTLTIPDAEAGGQTYVTQAGDTLSGIAKQFYEDESQWPKIYKANKETIGDDPDKLGVDVSLTIPA